MVSTFAGSNEGYKEDTGDKAKFAYPMAIYFHNGVFIVSDSYNHILRKMTLDGTTSLFAGTSETQGSTNGPALSAKFVIPQSVVVDGLGNTFVSELGRKVRMITPDENVETFAGTGVKGFKDGPG